MTNDSAVWTEIAFDGLEGVAGGRVVVDPGFSGNDCTADNPNGDYVAPSWSEVPDDQEGPDLEDVDLNEIEAAP